MAVITTTILTILGLISAGASIDQLSGGRFSNLFFNKKGFRSNYDLEMDEYNKKKNQAQNTNTRSRSRGNFFNFNRSNQTTGAARRFSILSFLGDRSRKLDDAPDIVDENQSVLAGIRNFGFSGLLPQTTLVPEIDNRKILDTGFEGVRKEIERINRNINSIANAITAGATIDRKYREQIIADMRKDLAEKGKDRSQTRSERSRFNLLTRPKQQIERTQKSLSKNLNKAFAVSLGIAEAFNLGRNFFDQNNNKETDDGGGEEDNTSSNSSSGDNPKVGDYYQSGTGKSKRYYVLEEDGGFRKTNVMPRSGKKYKKEDFNVVVEELKGNNQQQLPPGKKVENNKISFLPMYGGDTNFTDIYGDKSFNTAYTPSLNFDDLQESDTVVYDLTTKKEKVDFNGLTVPGTGGEDEIAYFDPKYTSSIWEAYSKSIG
tara:strand:- start:2209 stop:3501 length:1293 start_codon:yes stop_codon:yes gene_type:complete